MSGDKTERSLFAGVAALILVAAAVALVISVNNPGPAPGENKPPIAHFTPLNASVNLGDTVNFSAADSKDPDGTIRQWSWDFGDGSVASGNGTAGAIVSHKYEFTGAFLVRMTVTDDKGASGTLTTHVWVNLLVQVLGTATWSRQPPSANASSTPFPVDANASKLDVRLDVNTSAPAGTRAVVKVLDPNGATVYETNTTLNFGAPPIPILITLGRDNLSVAGLWALRVEALPISPTVQFTASVIYTGTVRVDYKPA